ncbi:uncharacterized protein LOC115878045 [Sitophilus oryzae]|uniref:RNA-directed DNA polymerase n=1 Tax=Sitophilus oryzae TaxID=7048 RepID=A0A6J2XH67_SITOR|nr:uncharacterized protein LOC115878045 [Sitophilus oryzae]
MSTPMIVLPLLSKLKQLPDLSALIEEYVDIFNYGLHQPKTKTVQHEIHLSDPHKKIMLKPYSLNPHLKEVMYEQVDEMLSAGVIEPSTSSYCFPVVMVSIDGKKPRFCVDYRQLNQITIEEPSILPKISDTLKDLGNATIFSVLDLKSGYWQAPLHPSSKQYIAFSTPEGALYQFTVMPFDLRNAPGAFQRLMTNEVLCGYLNNFDEVYLDDIIIYSPNLETHTYHLRLVYERLRIHGLRISPEKCQIATSEIDYLGHHISGNTILPQKKHILAIHDFPTPKSKKQLQTLLWLDRYKDSKSKLTRWALLLQEYSFDLRHCAGKDNELPDFLSRNPENKTFNIQDIDNERLLPPGSNSNITGPECVQVNNISHMNLFENVANAQRRSLPLRRKVSKWKRIHFKSHKNLSEQRFLDSYAVHEEEDLLYKRCRLSEKLVVPRAFIQAVIAFFHDNSENAHPGRDDTARQISRRYYFKNLHKTVGPYNTSRRGKKYILYVEDVVTKWVEADAFSEVDSKTIIKFLKYEVFSRFGVPQTIISDNGPQFRSKIYKKFSQDYNFNLLFVPIYHQQSRPVERRNQELKKVLRTLLLDKPEKHWDAYLPEALRILRTRRNAATDVTPAMALLGYDLPGAGEWNLPSYKSERDLAESKSCEERIHNIKIHQDEKDILTRQNYLQSFLMWETQL